MDACMEQIEVFNIESASVLIFTPSTNKTGILELYAGYSGTGAAGTLYLFKGSIGNYEEAKALVEQRGVIQPDLFATSHGGPASMILEGNAGQLTVVNIAAGNMHGFIKISQ